MDAPAIFMPSEAATATAPDGRRLVFFTVPQLAAVIDQVKAEQPKEFTYQWGYHPAEKIHVLLFRWPGGAAGAVAIPEGVGDAVLQYMTGTTDVFVTAAPVQERLSGAVSAEVVQEILQGQTVGLPGVKFAGQA